ncbi:GAF domain-containing sensor histidine kinase [Salegentibacter sp. LM13S]|uniref:GAF domain-containing sensor histidine kinase n=1 Tax=Salegentibacter lacus TaxID=2873599 RepID=UPI001CCE5EF6|nr:GAF domain-containing sensor histidine kinase [Salegentibacter lacus]MBZ9632096.1 GAF domain-containing sensor histidine kinase [Salegentibacter lacus]
MITPNTEFKRLVALSEFDLDYNKLKENFKNLSELAAKVTGTEISLVNLLDHHTQWTVSNYGVEIDQMPKEDSVCKHTITKEDFFEVRDLSRDERFFKKVYVNGELKLRYYFGIPLKTSQHHAIGALCVMDRKAMPISEEKLEILKLIAKEIVEKLEVLKAEKQIHHSFNEAVQVKNKLAHDIRGPVHGILGLSEIAIEEQTKDTAMSEYFSLIAESSSSLLKLTSEILQESKASKADKNFQTSLSALAQNLEALYMPQAGIKNIDFKVTITEEIPGEMFSSSKLLQIGGNLISNAIKFTPEEGAVTMHLSLLPVADNHKMLLFKVEDTGPGFSPEKIEEIVTGNAHSTTGTQGEKGHGLGLNMVQYLVESLSGNFSISPQDDGGVIQVEIPIMILEN